MCCFLYLFVIFINFYSFFTILNFQLNMLFTIDWKIPCSILYSISYKIILHTLKISYNSLWPRTSYMITFHATIIFAFDTISTYLFTNLTWILIRIKIAYPKECWLIFRFLFLNTLFFLWCKKYYWIAPNRTFRM